MTIFEFEVNLLINQIHERRQAYLLSFGLDPQFVVIPWGYNSLLEKQPSYWCEAHFDTYYGMIIIESRACKTIDDVRVY